VANLQPSVELPDSSRKVPSLTGQTFDEAQNTLLDLDLAATRAGESSTTVPADQVIRTDPPADTIVNPSDVIKIFVSTGPVPVVVPDVTNQPIADAQAAIEGLGFVSGSVTAENSPTVAVDVVIRTDPAAAASEFSGVIVNYTVSSGLVTLGDLTGQSLVAAIDLVNNESLMPDSQADYTCAQQSGSPIKAQSLAPGDVPQRSEITLTYCAGT
jgi:serine/threonine-protein kinase